MSQSLEQIMVKAEDIVSGLFVFTGRFNNDIGGPEFAAVSSVDLDTSESVKISFQNEAPDIKLPYGGYIRAMKMVND